MTTKDESRVSMDFHLDLYKRFKGDMERLCKGSTPSYTFVAQSIASRSRVSKCRLKFKHHNFVHVYKRSSKTDFKTQTNNSDHV